MWRTGRPIPYPRLVAGVVAGRSLKATVLSLCGTPLRAGGGGLAGQPSAPHEHLPFASGLTLTSPLFSPFTSVLVSSRRCSFPRRRVGGVRCKSLGL